METKERPLLYHNRELSWLKFNQRVLEQANDTSIPLLERLKFISIFSNNLDEFFMIRVGTLTDASMLNPDAVDNKSLMSPSEQLVAIFPEVRALLAQKDDAYQRLSGDLVREGIEHLDFSRLTQEQENFLSEYFTTEIAPMLSPQIIDKHHPFPFLKNKETYICAQLKTKGEFVKIAIIPVSTGFSRMHYLPYDKNRLVLIEELVHYYCERVFVGYEVVSKTVFRVTRNADINVDEALFDHDMDYRSVMEEMVKNRRRLMPVRIEFRYGASDAMIDQLCRKLELGKDRIFFCQTPLDMSFGFAFCGEMERRGRKDLFYPELRPQDSAMIDPKRPLIDQIMERDILLSYPYESMKPFIALLVEAASDESVLSIKMTLYRVARQSQIVAALIKAAENGKEVHVVVELRARFDEENNIVWSKRLEEAGVNVIYGLGQYKVHSKLLIITRKTEAGISLITQVGTGNYNESTAKLYTDISLMTFRREVGEDGLRIFNGILTDNPAEHTEHLLAAPTTMKPKMFYFIDREIDYALRGEPAEITIKINSLTDKDIIDRLIAASQAGVRIRMVIRGICCLKAGVLGYTDNIEVISIVGRFLEHSRVYMFGPPERCDMYISSADFMTRNTERRVEVAAPIYDEQIRKRIIEMIRLEFTDNVKAKRLLENGIYEPVRNNAPPTDSQIDLYKFAYVRSERTKAKTAQLTAAMTAAGSEKQFAPLPAAPVRAKEAKPGPRVELPTPSRKKPGFLTRLRRLFR